MQQLLAQVGASCSAWTAELSRHSSKHSNLFCDPHIPITLLWYPVKPLTSSLFSVFFNAQSQLMRLGASERSRAPSNADRCAPASSYLCSNIVEEETRSVFLHGPLVSSQFPLHSSLLAAVSVSKSECDPAVWRSREHCVLSSRWGSDRVLPAWICQLGFWERANHTPAEWSIVTPWHNPVTKLATFWQPSRTCFEKSASACARKWL